MAKKQTKAQPAADIQSESIDRYTERSLAVYGSYVLMGRALADWRDGLKPVQRRIAYDAFRESALPDRAHRKSAEIVGTTLGRFHPHGEASVYDTLVGMVHARYPLLEGHGNFGGPMFEAAAPRYTECRLSPFGASFFEEIRTADMVSNYSATDNEPVTLPSRVPLLLLNGSSGIGLGLSGSIPPHNLKEILDATIALAWNPAVDDDSLLDHIVGPDYGRGILCSSKQDIRSLYRTGKGTLHYRCDYSITDFHDREYQDHQILTIKDACPGWNARSFFMTMSKLADEGSILYCSDQSDANVKIVVGFRDARILQKRVIPLLHTQESYDFWAVRRDGEDSELLNNVKHENLRGLLSAFIAYRSTMLERKLRNELKLAEAKHMKADALCIASKHVDIIYQVLQKKTIDRDALVRSLLSALSAVTRVSEEQVKLILEEPIWRLARFEASKLEQQKAEIANEVARINGLLSNIRKALVVDLEDMRKFEDARGTRWSTREVKLVADHDTWVAARDQAAPIVRDLEIPVKARVYYDRIVRAKERVWIIEAGSTKLQSRDIAFLDDRPLHLTGLSSDLHELLVVHDGTGHGCVIHPRSSHPLNGLTVVADARGCNPNDQLLLIDSAGNALLTPVQESGRRRAGPLGLLPKPIVTVDVVPAGCAVYIKPNVTMVVGQLYPKVDTATVVGDLNYTHSTNGGRFLIGKEDLLSMVAVRSVRRTVPVV